MGDLLILAPREGLAGIRIERVVLQFFYRLHKLELSSLWLDDPSKSKTALGDKLMCQSAMAGHQQISLGTDEMPPFGYPLSTRFLL